MNVKLTTYFYVGIHYLPTLNENKHLFQHVQTYLKKQNAFNIHYNFIRKKIHKLNDTCILHIYMLEPIVVMNINVPPMYVNHSIVLYILCMKWEMLLRWQCTLKISIKQTKQNKQTNQSLIGKHSPKTDKFGNVYIYIYIMNG